MRQPPSKETQRRTLRLLPWLMLPIRLPRELLLYGSVDTPASASDAADAILFALHFHGLGAAALAARDE
jgi:hypothetical protein